MRRLTGMDAMFLYSEDIRPAALQHTLKVSIIDVSKGEDAYSFAATKEAIRSRLHLLPPFRWRLVPTPGGVHHPCWINDPDFDLDFHVRRIGCPAPGTITELCELISDIAGRPLDRAKPLWELFVIEGLADGTIAIVVKMHHAMADGVASSQLLDQFFDTVPGAEVTPPEPWVTEDPPSRVRMLAGGVRDIVRQSIPQLPAMVKNARSAAKATSALDLAEADLPPKMYEAESTFSNGMLTPHRRFTTLSVPLQHLRDIKTAHGTTINDVVLAISAGGLRRYLQRHDLDVSRPMVGSVPVSTRAEGERPLWGNHLAKIYVRLPVDEADPVARLAKARVYANQAKDDLARTLGSRLENWLEYMPPWFVTKILGRVLMAPAKRGVVTENLVVSNVPGPRDKLFIGNAEVTSFFSVGPLAETIGLNITAWSYVDQMNVCMLACREMVPDLWELTDDLRAAYVELYESAGSPSGPAATGGRSAEDVADVLHQ